MFVICEKLSIGNFSSVKLLREAHNALSRFTKVTSRVAFYASAVVLGRYEEFQKSIFKAAVK